MPGEKADGDRQDQDGEPDESGQWIKTSAMLAQPTGRRTRYPKAKPMSNVAPIHAMTGNRWFP